MVEGPPRDSTRLRGRRTVDSVSWLLGGALLATVIVVSLNVSEGREFVRLAERVRPGWFLLALVLQAATYLAQAEVFRGAPRAAGVSLPRVWLYRLSLTKLFLDQALPSAGISSTVAVSRALRQRGVPRDATAAAAVLNLVSYQAAFVVALLVALAVAAGVVRAHRPLLLVAGLFIAVVLSLTVALLMLPGRRAAIGRLLRRVPAVHGVVSFLEHADPHLARSPRLLAQAIAWQIAILVLDAATLWALIRSLGETAPGEAVFASFMVSSLFRTLGIVPGGLGIYEATSVLTLRMIGVGVPVALAATLLFRGLTFWLPMLPGLWFSRRMATPRGARAHPTRLDAYWALDPAAVASDLESGLQGLSGSEAAERLRTIGPNRIREQLGFSRLRVLAGQLRNPLLLILVFAAVMSLVTGEWIDATLVLGIVVASVGIGFSRESNAQAAVAALQARVRTQTRVVRDGQVTTIPVEQVVPGDVVVLSAGSLVPGDGILLEASDFFTSEAVLTGESFPVEKKPGVVPASAPIRDRSNCMLFGTSVRSGTARGLIVRTGAATTYGDVAARLRLRPPETEFDRGIRRFGYLLTVAMLILVLLVFVAHVLGGRPPIETLLFAVALAVGLSPELLPAILSVNLARGAQMMARDGVLVRRLNAIENLGSMDILCTDKTGTLTEGVVELEGAYDPLGARSPTVLSLGARNAALEAGLGSPLDDAILQVERPDLSRIRKLGEIPFDFVRKRVSIVVEDEAGVQLIAKGAFDHVLEACTRAGGSDLDASGRERLRDQYERWTRDGIRVVAVAMRTLEPKPTYARSDEQDLTFAGFLTFFDRPKEGVSKTIADLARLGVAVKVITGDSKLVAQHVATMVGLRADRVLTGGELLELNDEALWHEAERTDLFVEVDPNQKERIILALQRTGHVVGFLGDGINDAPALHAADAGLSVDSAADVAREAADFVLLERDLDVIRRGLEEGRKTFANTMKYVLTTTSANLGNMVSMALASLFLPFLPLLAGQILLNNFLSDIPAIGLADDRVDPEMVARPERWNLRMIGRFMVDFGVLSSLFDLVTFGVLLGVFRASPDLFRTGWFVESLLTELVVALVVRTRRPFYRSRPGRLLLVSTVVLIVITFLIPYLPFVSVLGFVPLPGTLLATVCGITLLYVLATEGAKRWFYRRDRLGGGPQPVLA